MAHGERLEAEGRATAEAELKRVQHKLQLAFARQAQGIEVLEEKMTEARRHADKFSVKFGFTLS